MSGESSGDQNLCSLAVISSSTVFLLLSFRLYLINFNQVLLFFFFFDLLKKDFIFFSLIISRGIIKFTKTKYEPNLDSIV